MRGTHNDPSNQRRRREAYPTVLVASNDIALRHSLTHSLQQERCLVLEAENTEGLLHFTISHSRPIHVLLVDIQIEDPPLISMVQRYRPSTRILIVAGNPNENRLGVLGLDAALAEIRSIIRGLNEVGEAEA